MYSLLVSEIVLVCHVCWYQFLVWRTWLVYQTLKRCITVNLDGALYKNSTVTRRQYTGTILSFCLLFTTPLYYCVRHSVCLREGRHALH